MVEKNNFKKISLCIFTSRKTIMAELATCNKKNFGKSKAASGYRKRFNKRKRVAEKIAMLAVSTPFLTLLTIGSTRTYSPLGGHMARQPESSRNTLVGAETW